MAKYIKVFRSVPLFPISSWILNHIFPSRWLLNLESAVFVLSITAQMHGLCIFCGLAKDHNVRQQGTVIWCVALWPGSGCSGATLYPGGDWGVGFRLDETRSLVRFTTKTHAHTYNVAVTETDLNFTNQTFPGHSFTSRSLCSVCILDIIYILHVCMRVCV